MVAAVVLVVPPVILRRVAHDADARAARGDVPVAAVVTPPTARVATPLASVRRLPGLVAGADPAQELRAKLAALAPDVNATSCLAVSVAGVPVFGLHETEPLVPASNTKLVTAAVALDVLGADYTFATTVLGLAAPDANGALGGDLFLVGGGDPLLTTAAYRAVLAADPVQVGTPFTSLESVADAVVAAGVRSVTGAVVGDDGRYDRQYYVPRLRADLKGSEVGPSSALAVDDGLSRFSPRVAATEPAVTAAATLATLLAERGVTVGGRARAGAAPREATTLATVRSAPLPVVLRQLLATSDDDAAELLVKEIGLVAKGQGASSAGIGVMVERLTAWLAPLGVDTQRVVLFDGSGLVGDNRLTCSVLLALLGRYGADSPIVQGLGTAGVQGTLVGNLKGTVAEGRLRAKTGSLPSLDVRTLSGVFPTADGTELLRFSYLLRRAGVASPPTNVDPYWARLATALATYPFRPDLTPYAPRPALT